MHCAFIDGPLDGWEHYCPFAETGEYWLARCDKYETFFEPALRYRAPEDASRLARYYLSEPGRMIYVGMVILK